MHIYSVHAFVAQPTATPTGRLATPATPPSAALETHQQLDRHPLNPTSHFPASCPHPQMSKPSQLKLKIAASMQPSWPPRGTGPRCPPAHTHSRASGHHLIDETPATGDDEGLFNFCTSAAVPVLSYTELPCLPEPAAATTGSKEIKYDWIEAIVT